MLELPEFVPASFLGDQALKEVPVPAVAFEDVALLDFFKVVLHLVPFIGLQPRSIMQNIRDLFD